MHVSDDHTGVAARQRALLQQRLRKISANHQTIPGIARQTRENQLPLSLFQEDIWLYCQSHPDSVLYHRLLAVRLTGTLEIPALERSLRHLVARHDVLRTTFREIGDELFQCIGPDLPFSLQLRDTPAGTQQNWETIVQTISRQEAHLPFDLENGPLFRATLVTNSNSAPPQAALLLTMHHIIADGWSDGVLLRDLMAFYIAEQRNQSASLPELVVQYADFAAWQRERLHGGSLNAQEAYWQQRLKEELTPLELPYNHPPSISENLKTVRHWFALDSSLTASLKTLSNEESCTLFMTLLAGFNALLHRYSGQQDIAVVSPVAGRTHTDVEPLIGCFINMLLLRNDLSGDPDVKELLRRVRSTCLAAFAHSEIPFGRLAELVHTTKGIGRTSLFPVSFQLRNVPRPPVLSTELDVERIMPDIGIAAFDLTVELFSEDDTLRGFLDYNADRIDESTIERLVGHYQTLLKGMAANPAQRVSRLPLLTSHEEHQILVEWNNTRKEYPANVTLPSLFETQVLRAPDAIAVRFERDTLTYRQLNSRANQLAHHLRILGVGTETLVGICIERSLDMVVGLLGILKAGGAYLPLDPSYPVERLRFMLEDSSVPVLLTQEHLAERLKDCLLESASSESRHLICLDQSWNHIEDSARQNQDGGSSLPEVSSANLAYIIYTSGSTGKPKGVLIEHGGLANYLLWAVDAYQGAAGTGAPVHSPLGFDLTITSLFLPLLVGGTIDLLPEYDAIDHLVQALQADRNYSVVKLTPAHLEILNHLLPPTAASRSTRTLVIGGEALTADHVAFWCRYAPNVRLINEYGPTETVVGCCIHEVDPNADLQEWTIPIGRPIANTSLYVLDRNQQPVPPGIAGELYIGGAGVARGYLHRPELTAERFVPDPFGTSREGKLYRTGDLVCWRPNGTLVFLGRIDQQVKIRGFRVELGEIEAALMTHPAISEAAVVAQGTTEDKRLVAYIVLKHASDCSMDEQRLYLQTKMPEHMIPSHFVALATLPLTPNGKIDRKSLQEQNPFLTERVTNHACPIDDYERRLSKLWESILRVSPIGVTESFFDLGGHSLLAIRLFTAIRHEFGVSLSLATMMQTPTIRQMACLLAPRSKDKPAWSPLVVLQPKGDRLPLFCAPVAGGSAFYYRHLATHIGSDQPLYTFEPIGMNGVDAPHETVEEMAAYYLRYLREVQPQGPYMLCGLSFGGMVAYEMARQLTDSGEKIGCLALFDTWAPGYPRHRRHDFFQFLRNIGFRIGFYRENLGACPTLNEKGKYIQSRLRLLPHIFAGWKAGKPWNVIHDNPVTLELPEAFQRVRQAEERARAKYSPERFSGRLTLFQAHQHNPQYIGEPVTGWREHVDSVKIIKTPGTHYSLLDYPCVRVLVEHLRLELESACN